MMSYAKMNKLPTDSYIKERNKKISEMKHKWNSKFIDTSHVEFIKDFYANIFTNHIKFFFTQGYVKKQKCPDCGREAEERCHSVGNERRILMKRALEKVWPDTSIKIKLRKILVAFMDEHVGTEFTFKCARCHSKETSSNHRRLRQPLY